MAGWQIALVITMSVGVAVILFGALWDRERNRRAAEQLTRPPDRSIPGFAGDDPAYVTDLPAHIDRPLSESDRAALRVRLANAPGFETRLAAPELVSDAATGWAIVEDASVLVCAEPVGSLRELLTFLDQAAGTKTPIVIAAPSFDSETIQTLVVNHRHRTLSVVAVTAEPNILAEIAQAVDAEPVSRTDLQSGWLPADSIGAATRWVSSSDTSWLA